MNEVAKVLLVLGATSLHIETVGWIILLDLPRVTIVPEEGLDLNKRGTLYVLESMSMVFVQHIVHLHVVEHSLVIIKPGQESQLVTLRPIPWYFRHHVWQALEVNRHVRDTLCVKGTLMLTAWVCHLALVQGEKQVCVLGLLVSFVVFSLSGLHASSLW